MAAIFLQGYGRICSRRLGIESAEGCSADAVAAAVTFRPCDDHVTALQYRDRGRALQSGRRRIDLEFFADPVACGIIDLRHDFRAIHKAVPIFHAVCPGHDKPTVGERSHLRERLVIRNRGRNKEFATDADAIVIVQLPVDAIRIHVARRAVVAHEDDHEAPTLESRDRRLVLVVAGGTVDQEYAPNPRSVGCKNPSRRGTSAIVAIGRAVVTPRHDEIAIAQRGYIGACKCPQVVDREPSGDSFAGRIEYLGEYLPCSIVEPGEYRIPVIQNRHRRFLQIVIAA